MEENNNKNEWEDVVPGVWKPRHEGDSITGVLVHRRENIGLNNSKAYILDTQEGLKLVWGSAILDERMALVNDGQLVRITFKETVKNKRGQPLHIYKVERKAGGV